MLQLVKPFPASEGYRAWKVLLEWREPDRPGRDVGQLQELISFHFAATNLEASIADFEYRVTTYEEQSGDKIGDMLKIAITQRSLSDAQLQMHLVTYAARLNTWELVRQEVRGVLSARHAIASYPSQPTPMEISFWGKKGK